MPRFVILNHDWPFPHWDFMLEAEQGLRTWRLLSLPEAGVRVSAEPLPDHRVEYLTYEGPISNGRGNVSQWDAGEYEIVGDLSGQLRIRLNGKRFVETVVIREESGKHWLDVL